MSKSDLFKQAIAEAKELKEISMEQAKRQIAESFAPRIQEMFKAKVQELDAMDEADEMEEGFDQLEEDSIEEVNETSLDEILAELDRESMDEGDDLEMEGLDLEEAKKDDDKKEDKKDDKPAAPKAPKKDDDDAEGDDLGLPADGMGADLDGMGSDLGGDEDVVDLSIEDFKNLVRDVVADVLAGGAGEGMGDDMGDLDGDAAGLDLGDGSDMGDDLGDDKLGEEFNLDEILAELSEEDDAELPGAPKEFGGIKGGMVGEAKDEELEEAVKTIEELRASLNEMNLFNAKLLYANKIMEAKSLNNTQKAKVLNAFDKANNLNEVKAVYKTLNTTLDSVKKVQLKESLGFASKAIGGAPAKPILEENAYVTRFQQLAGIKKLY
jgi:flagellar biosynthesis/type III secretory pathway chaperone